MEDTASFWDSLSAHELEVMLNELEDRMKLLDIELKNLLKALEKKENESDN